MMKEKEKEKNGTGVQFAGNIAACFCWWWWKMGWVIEGYVQEQSVQRRLCPGRVESRARKKDSQ